MGACTEKLTNFSVAVMQLSGLVSPCCADLSPALCHQAGSVHDRSYIADNAAFALQPRSEGPNGSVLCSDPDTI